VNRPLAVVLASLLSLLGSAWAAESAAQQTASPPLDARGVAALVQSFYDQTTTLTARFEQTQFTKVYNRRERASGRVVFKKPGRMRWDYDAPNGQVFVTDGEKLLVYQPPDDGERHGQLIERDVDEDQLPLAFSFLTGTGRLDRDFRLRLLDPERQGFDGYVLELRPRRPTPHYDRVLFFVRVLSRGGRRAGIIQGVLIVDSAGNRNRFEFSDMSFRENVPDSRFEYTPPAGTRRVRP